MCYMLHKLYGLAILQVGKEEPRSVSSALAGQQEKRYGHFPQHAG